MNTCPPATEPGRDGTALPAGTGGTGHGGVPRDDVTVLIVDDDRIVRAGLRVVLEDPAGPRRPGDPAALRVVGEADDGAAGRELVRRIAPDVVLIGLRTPGCDGIEVVRLLRSHRPAPAVVVLAAVGSDEHVLGALRAGASGYLLTNAPPESVAAAVRAAGRGEPAFSPAVIERMVRMVAGGGDRRADACARLDRLTERERTVARAVGRGWSNARIADEEYMSLSTVKAYISRALSTLELDNRVQLALLVRDAGE